MNEYREPKWRREWLLNHYAPTIYHPHDYGIHRMLGYDRYFEAGHILSSLEHDRGELLSDLTVLDFGCGVGDYGFSFGRQGSQVIFYDFTPLLNFIRFRLEREQRPFEWTLIAADQSQTEYEAYQLALKQKPDVVIFGEVLEHVEHPALLLDSVYQSGAKYIFTSSYPYRSDDPNESYWQHGDHKDSARLEQPACRDILETNYELIANYGGQANLWTRK